MELRLSCLTHRDEAELMWSGMLICRSLGINLWRSESVWEFNIFASSVIWRHSDCIQVVKILPPGNQGSIYFMQPISWLLIKWWHKVIWYRRPLYWRNLTEIFWPKHWLDSIIYVVRQAHEKKSLMSSFICRPNNEYDVDGLALDCCNSIAYALELFRTCTKPSMCKNVEW